MLSINKVDQKDQLSLSALVELLVEQPVLSSQWLHLKGAITPALRRLCNTLAILFWENTKIAWRHLNYTLSILF